MTRTSLLVVVAALAVTSACARTSWKGSAKAMGSNFAKIGGNVAKTVKPIGKNIQVAVAPIAARVDVKALVGATVRARVGATAGNAIDAIAIEDGIGAKDALAAGGSIAGDTLASREPITINKRIGGKRRNARADGDAAPAPAPTAEPAITVNRTNAAKPTVFVLRGQTHGGKSFCESYTTYDACTSSCTSMLRANALTKPTATTPTSCSCTELDRGC